MNSGLGVTTLIVQLPDDLRDGSPRVLELGQGQLATFGRGSADRPVDIVVPDPGVSRLAGSLRAVEDHWLISNLSRHTTYVVENPEGGGEFVKVAPRRLEMPVPFEFARVVLPSRGERASFAVFAPQHTYADPGAPPGAGPDATVTSFPLDETAKYFLVLVALCEPRLRGRAAVALPTVPELLERLRGLDSCRDLTRTAVNFHIEYLARNKLRVKQPVDGPGIRPAAGTGGGDPGSGKADWQREALVSLALRFDLVTEDHLALLPSRLRRSAAPAPG